MAKPVIPYRVRSYLSLVLSLTLFSGQVQASVAGTAISAISKIARSGNLPTREFSQLGLQSSKKLSEAGVARVKMAADEKQIALIFLNSSEQEVKRFFVNRATAQQLAPFKPSKFREWTSKVKSGAGKIALEKAKHFPMEATSFFVAIGALTVYDLIFNYSTNPLVAEQFLESQKDPVTHISFLAFMQANGLAAEPLLEMVEKPWLRKYIPYLGMAVGMAASQMVHGVAHAEILKACSKSLTTETTHQSGEKCDKAWSNFGTGWGPVVSEFSTSLVTMFMSSVFAAAGSWIATAVFEKSIQMMGMQLVSFAIPGGGVARTVRFVFNTGKNIHFLAWDAYLRAPIENYFANAGANQQIEKLSECLGAQLSAQKRNKWQDSESMASDERFTIRHFCEGNASQSADKFFDLYRQWRSVNLKEAVTAQQNWFQYLSNLTNHYRTTQSFYQDVTDKVYKKMYRLTDKSSSPLDQAVPLFGVKTSAKDDVDWSAYLDYPQDLVKDQVLIVNQAAEQMSLDRKATDGLYVVLTPKEKRIFDQVQAALTSQDLKVIAEGLLITKRIYERPEGILLPSHEFLTSDQFKTGFRDILKMVGKPDPQLLPGQGFLTAWKIVEGKELSPFGNRLQRLLTPTAPEFLVASMAYGPDASLGENLISKWGYSGFQAYFQPPKILRGNEVQKIQAPGNESIFTHKIWIDSNPAACGSADRACYHPVFDWVRSGHIKPEIMTAEGNNFSTWWNQNVEPQYLKAWKNFELKYEENVQSLANTLFNTKNHFANSTVVPNSPLLALEQERSVALTILSAIYNATSDATAVEKVFNRKFNVIKDATQLNVSGFPALQTYVAQWSATRELFKKVRVPMSKDTSEKFFVSRLTETELILAQEKLDAQLELVAIELETKTKSNVALRLSESALTSLMGSHQELLDYGMIINSASYVENHIAGTITRKRCMTRLSSLSSGQNLFRGLENNKDCQDGKDLLKSNN